jgi:hypothetical protein
LILQGLFLFQRPSVLAFRWRALISFLVQIALESICTKKEIKFHASRKRIDGTCDQKNNDLSLARSDPFGQWNTTGNCGCSLPIGSFAIIS